MGDNICGNCKHWRAKLATSEEQKENLGQCLESPPQLLVLPSGPGRVGIEIRYPTIPEVFMACSRYQPKLTVIEDTPCPN